MSHVTFKRSHITCPCRHEKYISHFYFTEFPRPLLICALLPVACLNTHVAMFNFLNPYITVLNKEYRALESALVAASYITRHNGVPSMYD